MQKIIGERYKYKFLTVPDHSENENDALKIIKMEHDEPEVLAVESIDML